MVEALKFGLGTSNEIGDPDSKDITADDKQTLLNFLRSVTGDNLTRTIAMKIRDKTQPDQSFYGLSPGSTLDHGSSQLCIVSHDGDALAMTTSINSEFGALFLSRQTGIWMNNGMNDFLKTSQAGQSRSRNFIAPEKRPVSSMAPTILVNTDGDVVLAITSTDSSTISSGIAAQVLTRILWMNHTVKEAIDCGRLHSQFHPDQVFRENTADNDVVQGLRHRGHKIAKGDWDGNVIAIARDARTGLLNGTYFRRKSSGGVDGA